jgi:dienelactone hydrolase/pimeloyl-ACP methyl ester carboxylesterase
MCAQPQKRSPSGVSWALSRRQLLQAAVAQAVSLPLLPWLAAEEAVAGEPPAPLPPLNRFPRMVQEYFVAQVRAAEAKGLAAKRALQTKADAEAYVRAVQAKIRRCFGPEPERTPLNPRVTGVVERDAYRIEKVIFDSRPGFPVTANLYLPAGRSQRVPGVVGTCGHSANGKAEKAYQSFAQGLARMGYACLIFDPIGQGERLQYVKEDLTPRFGAGVTEHLIAGNQQFLVGEFLGMWRAWDGIRALDYLATRPEVDPQQIGVTGNSGGGTMTTWLCGVEQRWSMAAPSCFVTTFRRNMENELPADTEQCPPRALALGLDHDDFLAALAPKPIIILGKERDYFDARGVEEAHARLSRLYQLLDAPDNIAVFIGPTTHGYTQENREAMYRWFNGVTKVSDATEEPPLTIEEDEVLWCTPKGQVAELGARTVFQFTRDKSQQLAAARGAVSGDALTRAMTDVLKLPERSGAPDYRILRYLSSRRYPLPQAVAYAVETEPGIQALVYRLYQESWVSRPPRTGPRALLYVAHLSSDAELREEPLVRDVLQAEPDTPLFTCDVRGIGESRPETCGVNTFHSRYGSDYFYAIHSLMLDRPYLGQKTHDVLGVLDWLTALGHTDVHLVAKGWGALAGTFAAVLHPSVRQVTLKNALTAYGDVAESEEYAWPLAALLPDVLAHFDLPDCYRALEAKQLRIMEPWDAMAR